MFVHCCLTSFLVLQLRAVVLWEGQCPRAEALFTLPKGNAVSVTQRGDSGQTLKLRQLWNI